MSQENVEMLSRDLQPAPGMPEVMKGRAAVVDVWKQWLEVLDNWKIEVHEIVDADPWVVSDVHWFAKGKGSEITIDWRVTEAHRFRNGKIECSIFGYQNIPAALEAIGLARAGRCVVKPDRGNTPVYGEPDWGEHTDPVAGGGRPDPARHSRKRLIDGPRKTRKQVCFTCGPA